jgi:hypothetical protein
MPLVTTGEDQHWETWDDPVRGRLRWCLLVDGPDPDPESVRAVVALDGEETTVGLGALVRVPANAEHGIRALDELARVLFLFPTTAFEDVVYHFGEEAAA